MLDDFDGLHDIENVSLEIDYFLNHLCNQTIFILDDINSFDFESIKKKLNNNNFKSHPQYHRGQGQLRQDYCE